MSKAIDVSTSTWDAEVGSADTPVVVDFWAPWCGPCRMVAPELDKLSGRVGDKVKFVKVNIDENRDLAVRFGVMSIPTIAMFEKGSLVKQVVGARGADALAKEFGLEG
ncbi:MAG: thioredoxin [Coriobacteriales bacterium]|nr:thioredoxin [Coriobacteriales bacterium]